MRWARQRNQRRSDVASALICERLQSPELDNLSSTGIKWGSYQIPPWYKK